jgi:hypothetical protein
MNGFHTRKHVQTPDLDCGKQQTSGAAQSTLRMQRQKTEKMLRYNEHHQRLFLK